MNGRKGYELRKNDRDYQRGDLVSFIINDFADDEWQLPTFRITHVLQDVPAYGLQSGFCILSLEKIVEEKKTKNKKINRLTPPPT